MFKPPRSVQTRYARGEPLVFALVVVGRAIDYLPYFVLAFRELRAFGFGLNRARVTLAGVDALDHDGSPTRVYDAASNLVRRSPSLPLQLDLADKAGGSRDVLVLDFLTPATLRAGSGVDRDAVVVRRPQFHHVLKRLRDRLNALSSFYGDGPLDLDFKALGDEAEGVETVDDQTRWVERARVSTRRGVAHDLSGFVGSEALGLVVHR